MIALILLRVSEYLRFFYPAEVNAPAVHPGRAPLARMIRLQAPNDPFLMRNDTHRICSKHA